MPSLPSELKQMGKSTWPERVWFFWRLGFRVWEFGVHLVLQRLSAFGQHLIEGFRVSGGFGIWGLALRVWGRFWSLELKPYRSDIQRKKRIPSSKNPINSSPTRNPGQRSTCQRTRSQMRDVALASRVRGHQFDFVPNLL